MAINKKLGAATGVGAVGALGVTTAAAAPITSVAPAIMAKLYGTAVTMPSGGGMLAAANPAVAGAVAALPLVMGLTNMPSGKANIAKLKKAKQDRKTENTMSILEDTEFKPDGMSREKYIKSMQSPETPWEQEQQSIIGTSVNHYSPGNPGGDSDYEVDSARQQWEMNPERDRINAEWLAQGDNAKWYNPDMTRTDYAGPYAPGLEDQKKEAEKLYGDTGQIDTSNPSVNDVELDSVNDVELDPDVIKKMNTPPGQSVQLADGTKFNYTQHTVGTDELGTTDGKLLDDGVKVSTDNIKISTAVLKDLGVPDVNVVGNLPTLEEVTLGITDDDLIAEVTSELSERYLKAEEEARSSVENFEAFYGSSVKEQFALLQDDWTGMDGKSRIPFYARGAVTAANQAMAARGMSGSSMAAAAITQAGLESMMPAAMADAQFMQTLSVKAFDAKTAIGVAKLSHIANLDVADLNFAQKRAVDNANKFFQMNMDNVANERIVAATNNANDVQKLFTDSAAINVATNLAFTTEAEMTRFYDELAFQAADSTARLTLDAEKFNAATKNARSQFNASMTAEIEKDNINYLRSVNTANTAGVNQQNMVNTQNLLNISNTEIANALTLQRDELQKIFEASENASDRANNYAIASLNQSGAMNRLTSAQSHESAQNLGGFFSDVGNNLFSTWSKNEFRTTWLK